MKVMIEKDATCTTFCGERDKTPLHYAAEKGHINMVQIILDAKPQPDINAV